MRWISVVIALIFLLAIIIWMATGNIGREAVYQATLKRETNNNLQLDEQPFLVRVNISEALPFNLTVSTNGYTKAIRCSQIKSKINAKVVKIADHEGKLVTKGEPLVNLSIDTRESALRAAKAALDHSHKNYQAIKDLSDNGFQSELELLSARESLAVAEQNMIQAKQELDNTIITSPYDGIIQNLHIEQGDLVSPGQTVATIIDLDPIEVIAYVSERELYQIRLKQKVQIELLNGTKLMGSLVYISPSSNLNTGTFEIRAIIPNPQMTLVEGLNGLVSVEVGTIMAHFQSKNVLTLNDQGIVGVKAVNKDNQVIFYPVELLDDTRDGVYLAGLPLRVSLIVQGHNFVTVGTKVRVIEEIS